MSKKILVNDRVSFPKDTIDVGGGGLWAKTQVITGHGYNSGRSKDGRMRMSFLDEQLTDDENTVPISGVQDVLSYLFGVKAPITIPTLYSDLGIGLPDETDVPNFLVPTSTIVDGSATYQKSIFQVGHLVQLFGLGITGTAENNITVPKVGYRETKIQMSVKTSDGTLNGIMYPFRYTEASLDSQERQKYFGKKVDASTGKTGYYLKRFETNPEIRHIWKTSDDMDSDNEVVVDSDTVFDFTRDDAINSFVEMHMTVSKKDLKEYFQYALNQPEATRFNTLALFTGRYSEQGKTDSQQFGDYTNVRLFSKVNIPVEHLSLQKDLEIIYRVYGS